MERRRPENDLSAADMQAALQAAREVIKATWTVDTQPLHDALKARWRGDHSLFGEAWDERLAVAVGRLETRAAGGRSPSPSRTRTGPGRDAAALYPRRRLIMTSPGRSRARPARPLTEPGVRRLSGRFWGGC